MTHTRPINPVEKQNFETLVAAIHAGRACLMSVYDQQTDRPAVPVCAINHSADDATPF